MARWSCRAAVTLGVAAFTIGARAHELRCQKLVSLVQVDSLGHPHVVDGVPALSWPNTAGMAPIDRYPAVLAYQLLVENLAQEPSVLREIQESLDAVPASRIVRRFGSDLTP